MDFDEVDEVAPQDCEEESPLQAHPWNGPEAQGRAVLLIEGLKVRITTNVLLFLPKCSHPSHKQSLLNYSGPKLHSTGNMGRGVMTVVCVGYEV